MKTFDVERIPAQVKDDIIKVLSYNLKYFDQGMGRGHWEISSDVLADIVSLMQTGVIDHNE